MRDFWEETENKKTRKKLNKKKISIILITATILIFTISISIIYMNNKEVRACIEKNIFQK